MSNPQRIHIIDLKTTSREVVEVTASYSKDRKAFFLHLQPLVRSNSDNGFSMTSCDPMLGMRAAVLSAERFSAKKLQEVKTNYLSYPQYAPMLAQVLEGSELKLAE